MCRSVKITCVFPIILLLLSSSALRGEPDKDAWSQLIGAAGFTRETCRIDQLDLANWGGDDYSLPFYRAMHGDPLRIPFYVMQFRVNMLQSAGSLGNSTIKGGLLIMEGTRINLLGNLLASFPQCKDEDETVYFMNALKSLSWKDSSNGKDDQSIISTLGKIPPDIRRNAGFLMNVIAKSIEWRNQSLKRLSQKDLEALFSSLSSAKKPFIDEVPRDDLKQIISKINFKYLLRGAEELGFAVDFAVAELSKRSGQEEFSFEVNTPHGVIALNGKQDNKYSGELSYLLVIDTGGNDLYHGGGATANIRNPVSVLIDLEGDDSYLESPELKNISIAEYQERKTAGKPLFGVGILGYGILVDVKENDFYQGTWYTLGSAAHFAVGALFDEGGDDSYNSPLVSMGAAVDFSVGFLIDYAGNDTYTAGSLCLGSGNANGFGFFWDRSGNDKYKLTDPKAGAFGFASVDKSILNIRDRNITAGFFLDTGGDDIYPDTVPLLKNNILWEMSPDVEKRIYPVLRGKGIDMEAPETMLPW